MKIIVDTPGCELGPETAIQAGIEASQKLDIEIAFSGNRFVVEKFLKKHHSIPHSFEIIHSDDVIGMDENVHVSLRKKPNASIVCALKCLKNSTCDGLVSSGNTGATVVAAREILGLIQGIKRPALCRAIPTIQAKHALLVDVGASANIQAKDIVNFAIMGSAASKEYFNIDNPKVFILNIGKEKYKGSSLLKRSRKLLEKSAVNFLGNIEGHEIWTGKADVIVTDGVTGNIVLKSSEGLAKVILNQLIPFLNFKSDGLTDIFRKFSPSSYGGAPLLGVNGVCMVCHGETSVDELFKAIEHAKWCIERKLDMCIINALRKTDLK